ncbi:uncharacterized protein EDB91DRAFT_1083376 [Suillus paluster]|uniref:uncharacterized protein n=1 Tax=Suillus paluster TaxID=48578 RepID=UPI001B87DF87|nr:uncharacterized protein EDB91DRAFT_1083376 [Suillus paluster]KAG1736413.1 hypothetical protein EDB91DRAFT_1083376 [Suillus paluster]
MTTESETFDSKPPFVVFSFYQPSGNVPLFYLVSCDLVSAPGDTSSSVASTANACTTALAAAQFFHLLQTLNIKIGQFNHVFFTQLNFGSIDVKDESLKHFLGCPPDEVQVGEGGKPDRNQFIASFCIRMFQKHLRITQQVD